MKNNLTSKFLIFSALALVVFTLASCADVEPVKECLTGKQYGFLYGLLHGFITPISFIASLFDDNVAIYAVNNKGGWYDLGFLLGSGGWGFLAGNKSKKKG
jgi:hypothetical protein